MGQRSSSGVSNRCLALKDPVQIGLNTPRRPGRRSPKPVPWHRPPAFFDPHHRRCSAGHNPFFPEQMETESMERANKRSRPRTGDQTIHPPCHLPGRLVGKGDGQNPLGKIPLSETIWAMRRGQCQGFSRARTGNDHHRTAAMGDGPVLLRVETGWAGGFHIDFRRRCLPGGMGPFFFPAAPVRRRLLFFWGW